MTNSKAYLPFAAVALIAGVLGWGASAYSNHQTAEAMPNNLAPLALTQPNAQTGVLPNGQIVTVQPMPAVQPMQAAQTAYALQPVAVVPAAPQQVIVNQAPVGQAPAAQSASSRAQTAPMVVRNSREDTSTATAPRKRGMSNKAKTAIAIGSGAGVGAAIGGIAKGGKGAAIGAIAGGGAGAVYSWIKHKKGQPVF